MHIAFYSDDKCAKTGGKKQWLCLIIVLLVHSPIRHLVVEAETHSSMVGVMVQDKFHREQYLRLVA